MDCGLKNAVMHHTSIAGENIGHLVESIIRKHAFVYANTRGMTVSYYREKREVDIVLHSRDTVIPVEVKYQYTISGTGHKNLIAFMEKFKVDKGVLVTRDLLATHKINGKEIRMIPAWLFLIMLS